MNNNDYRKLYFGLYSELADIIDELQNIQNKYEKLYIEAGGKLDEQQI